MERYEKMKLEFDETDDIVTKSWLKKFLEKCLNELESGGNTLPSKPKKSVKKEEKRGRPKKDAVLERKERVLDVLAQLNKPVNLPELNSLLSIPDENTHLKRNYGYAVKTLVAERKVKELKDEYGHPTYIIDDD